MIYKDSRSRLACVGVAVLVVLALVACSSPTPTAAPAPQATNAPAAPAQPAQPAATQPPVKETVIVKETVVVPPTTAPTVTPTATATARPGGVVAPKPTSAGKLDLTVDFGPSAPRSGDNKVQVTVILHVIGGVPPFQAQQDGIAQKVTKRVDGVQYVLDWHNCGVDEPHTFTVISADGQTASLKAMIPYGAYKCP